jgi:hypothetical protein
MARDRHVQPTECFEFIWWRRQKGLGFRWQRDRRGRCFLLGPPNDSLLAYQPLVEETGLFLTFAHLDGSEGEFLRFANTYGRLGTYHTFGPEHGEPFDEWQRHHRWLQFLAQLRNECLKARPELDEVVSWEGNEVIYRFPKINDGDSEDWRHRGRLRQCPRSKKGVPLFQPGDLAGPALWFLGHAIQDWLKELAHWEKPITPQLVWSEQDSRPQFVFGPSSLLGAMICQFAAALHGTWPFKECACCHKFFRLAPGVNRANRLTCSLTCKQYLHNHRVEHARQLHAQGRTVPQIAKELIVKPQGKKSSVQIVKTWIDRD